MRDADFAVTVKIQERIDKSPHLRSAAFMGDILEGSLYAAGPVVSVVIVAFLTLVVFIDIKHRKVRFSALLIPLLFALMTCVEIYGKTVVHHPAPPFLFVKNPISHFPPYHIIEEFSYPSGHAARAVFMSIVMFFTIRSYIQGSVQRRISILLLFFGVIYSILISLSVIYLGHHWLSDIVGGVLLGFGAGLALYLSVRHYA